MTEPLIDVESSEQAQSLVQESEFLLLGFKAPWCPQCGPQRGVVERVFGRYSDRIRFAYLDIASDERAADTYSVSALPTLALFKNGEEVTRLTGFTPAAKLTSSLDSLLAED